jgi:predicted ATP-grasp superfamily ATP-dependent carboligase
MPGLSGSRVVSATVGVLLTGTEYTGGLAALRALRAAGHAPWAAVSDTGAHGARSRAAVGVVEVPDAREDPEGFTEAIVDGADRAQARVVLPGTDSGMLALAAYADRFAPDVALGVCPPTTTVVATDKVATLARAAQAGVRVLSARVLGVDGPPQPGDVQFPVVVKPMRSEGGQRRHPTRRADDLEALILALAALPNGAGMVQAYVEGRLLNVNGVAWEGEVIADVHEEALRTWPADCGPVSYAQTIEPEPALADQARALIAALGWSGIFNLQFIESDVGLFLVDVNPRLDASIGLAVAAGANLPAIWVELLLGRRPEVGPYRVGVRFRSGRDLRSLTHLFRSGARRAALAGLLPQPHTTHAIASVSDPRPGLAYLRRLPGRLMPTDGVLTRAPGL